MKYLLTILLAACVYLQADAQQPMRLSAMCWYYYDQSSNSLLLADSVYYKYNGNNAIRMPKADAYQMIFKDLWSRYHITGVDYRIIDYAYDTAFGKGGFTSQTIDANGNVVKQEFYEYNTPTAGITSMTSRSTRKYNAAGKIEEYLLETISGGVPQQEQTANYKYDASGNLTEQMWTWAGASDWMKQVYTYNGSQLITKETYSKSIVPKKYEYKYEAGATLPDSVLVSDFSAGAWLAPTEITDYSYDAAGHLSQMAGWRFNRVSQQWQGPFTNSFMFNAQGGLMEEPRSSTKTSFGYDQEGRIVKVDEWKWSGGQWKYDIYTPQLKLYYEPYPATEVDDVAISQTLSIYPNPAKGEVYIDASFASTGKLNATIYDMQGRIVRQWSETAVGGKYNKQINVAELPAGQYSIKLQRGGVQYSGKFTVLR